MTDFLLPELGENVTAGDVLRLLVKPGDTIEKDQAVLELETDKATIEVPSSVAGVVKAVKVKEGDKVKTGQAILTVEESGAPAAKSTPPPASAAAPPGKEKPSSAVGANTPERVPSGEPGFEQHVEGPKRPAESSSSRAPEKVVDFSRGARHAAEPVAEQGPLVPAAPSVRRLARELGADIAQVPGTGPSGRISMDDVKAHVKRMVSGASQAASGAASPLAEPLPDFTRWGTIDRQPMRAVRRRTAERLTMAWTTIPHVTQHDLADVTGFEKVKAGYAKRAGDEAGSHLTITAMAVKIAAAALRAFPQFNASIDMAAGEIVYKKYVNIGIAVDTDRGLLVPVIRDADTKTVLEIAADLASLSEKARNRKITLDEMQGGCFSISNLGGIGGSYFTPIINPPEVAILGISRARIEPVFDKQTGQFAPRLMLPLSLSYDHRVVDGADGIRFLRWMVEVFEQPFLLSL